MLDWYVTVCDTLIFFVLSLFSKSVQGKHWRWSSQIATSRSPWKARTSETNTISQKIAEDPKRLETAESLQNFSEFSHLFNWGLCLLSSTVVWCGDLDGPGPIDIGNMSCFARSDLTPVRPLQKTAAWVPQSQISLKNSVPSLCHLCAISVPSLCHLTYWQNLDLVTSCDILWLVFWLVMWLLFTERNRVEVGSDGQTLCGDPQRDHRTGAIMWTMSDRWTSHIAVYFFEVLCTVAPVFSVFPVLCLSSSRWTALEAARETQKTTRRDFDVERDMPTSRSQRFQ